MDNHNVTAYIENNMITASSNLYNYNIMVLHLINVVSGLVQFTILNYLKDLETPPLLIIGCIADIRQ